MARNFSPRGRIEKREQQDLSLFSGVTPRESKFKIDAGPGQHGAQRRKLSEYGKQFRAKQLAKRLYGILERQFRNYFRKASQQKGSTGETLVRFLELRLDNVVYRLGFARTRKEARQLVSHRSIMIKNEKGERVVNLPSYQVRPGDEIMVVEQARQQGRVQESQELAKQRTLSDWLEAYPDQYRGVVKRLPERSEMPQEINELLIVELYSK